MIFCTKVVQKVAKQMPVNLVQGNVKYQGKYVLCLDMHFGHITKMVDEFEERYG